jgi:hypothetical protein
MLIAKCVFINWSLEDWMRPATKSGGNSPNAKIHAIVGSYTAKNTAECPCSSSDLAMVTSLCYLAFDPAYFFPQSHVNFLNNYRMAATAYAQPFRCPACDALHAHFKTLLDTYRRVCVHYLELGGIDAASAQTRREYRDCEEARNVWLQHCKEHGCE